MDLPDLVEHSFHQHGNWQGLSLGWVTTVWLAHLLSEADHRLNSRPAVGRAPAERPCRPARQRPVRGLDLTDDRLASVLRTLSDDGALGPAFERALTRTRRRVYDLRPERVRVDQHHRQRLRAGDRRRPVPVRPQPGPAAGPAPTQGHAGHPRPAGPAGGHRGGRRPPRRRPALPAGHRPRAQRPGPARAAATSATARWPAWPRGPGVAFHRDYYLCPLPVVHLPPAALAAEVAAVSRGEQPAPRIARVPATGTPAPPGRWR